MPDKTSDTQKQAAAMVRHYFKRRSREVTGEPAHELVALLRKATPNKRTLAATAFGAWCLEVIAFVPETVAEGFPTRQSLFDAILDTVEWRGGLKPPYHVESYAARVLSPDERARQQQYEDEQHVQQAHRSLRLHNRRKAQLEATKSRLVEELLLQGARRVHIPYTILGDGSISVTRVETYDGANQRITLADDLEHAPCGLAQLLQDFARHMAAHHMSADDAEGSEGTVSLDSGTHTAVIRHTARTVTRTTSERKI